MLCQENPHIRKLHEKSQKTFLKKYLSLFILHEMCISQSSKNFIFCCSCENAERHKQSQTVVKSLIMLCNFIRDLIIYSLGHIKC